MNVTDFAFDLPLELIAQEAAPRGTSRLLVLDRATGTCRHGSFADLPAVLRRGDLLVVNNTRVFAARLLGHRVPSGGAVECLLLGAVQDADRSLSCDTTDPGPRIPDPGARDAADPGSRIPDPDSRAATAPGSRLPDPDSRDGAPKPTSRIYDALMHPGQKLKPGSRVRFEGPQGVLIAEVLARRFQGRRTIRLFVEGPGDVDTLVDALGHVPLPPYIKRSDTPADRERYQTVYARARGSVAAPTAGLHFTPDLLTALDDAGVERAEVTLHVGYGTFKPVRVERIEDHVVDPEPYEIPVSTAASIARAKGEGRRVIAVGTTTTRALEDAARRGNGPVTAGKGIATVFIYPGHVFRAIDGLLTNFHLPSSSLLMLVAAFAGREAVLDAYREAVAERYRFYSYGDAMLIV
jgi:S-adenosylmethionine:tRNA ribosyltransferase-isomerase